MNLKLRSDDLEWREIDGEVVALDTRRAEYLAVDGSGAALWRALQAGTTHGQLVESLVERYAIDAARAAADVDAFIAQLRDRGLLAA